jgi:hypothetical protein
VQGNQSWTIVAIDPQVAGSDIGRNPSFLSDVNGAPAVVYSVNNSAIVFMRAASPNGIGPAWTKQPPVTSFSANSNGVTTVSGNLPLTNASVIVLTNGSSIVILGQANLAGTLVCFCYCFICSFRK